jgi:hypothetical protein
MMKQLIVAAVLWACALAQQPATPAQPTAPARPNAPAQTEPAKERLTMPQATTREAYYQHLRVRAAGTPPWRWTFASGRLPPGLALEANGVIAGTPRNSGDYRFVVAATDSARPARVVEVEVLLAVRDPLAVEWQQAPLVANRNGNGIFGTIEVTNNSSMTMDLTVIIVAVNEIGRATALGYQHFPFPPGKTQTIPFGSTLPRGTYVVHADAVGEIASTNTILRARQQTGNISVP